MWNNLPRLVSDIFQIPSSSGLPGDQNQILPAILNAILHQLVSFAYPLAFISLLYSAYILITSAGKPEAITTAKKNTLYLSTGIFLIVFAAIFVRFVTGIFLKA